MSKKFTSVSMSLKLSTADWLPKNRTTSPAKVEKRSANEDPLRQTTINSCDARRPLIAIITKKEPQKTFWLAYRANIRSDAPTTKKAATIDEKVTRYTYRLILLLLRKNCIYLSRIICIFSRLKISSKNSFFSFLFCLSNKNLSSQSCLVSRLWQAVNHI